MNNKVLMQQKVLIQNVSQGGDAGQQQKADDGVVDAEFTEGKMTKIICL